MFVYSEYSGQLGRNGLELELSDTGVKTWVKYSCLLFVPVSAKCRDPQRLSTTMKTYRGHGVNAPYIFNLGR
jgi:hypothetical protein